MQEIVDWVNVAPLIGVYAAFFAIAYLENVIPPIPGDLLIVFSGYLVAEGLVSFTILLLLTTIASVIGFMTMYWVGYKWGAGVNYENQNHFFLRFVKYKTFRRSKFWMNRYGQWVVMANRFLAGTRSIISIMAGIMHLKISHTILNSLISSILWNALLITVGIYIKDNWLKIGNYLSRYGEIVLIILILVLVIWIFSRYKASMKKKEQLKK